MPLKTLEIHQSPVRLMRFNERFSTVITMDKKVRRHHRDLRGWARDRDYSPATPLQGMVEYWDSDEYGDSKNTRFKYKTSTDL